MAYNSDPGIERLPVSYLVLARKYRPGSPKPSNRRRLAMDKGGP